MHPTDPPNLATAAAAPPTPERSLWQVLGDAIRGTGAD